MGRPLDWGDHHPSDLDDLAPFDPASTLSETTVNPLLNQPQSSAKDIFYDFNETIEEDPVPELPREVFVGIVLFEYTKRDDSFRYFSVLLENGETVKATCLQLQSMQFIEDAEAVLCVRGTNKNQWFITGPKLWQSLYVLECGRTNNSTEFVTNKLMEYDFVRYSLGKTSDGKDPFTVNTDQIVLNDGGLFRIDFVITLGPGNTIIDVSLGSCRTVNNGLTVLSTSSAAPGWLKAQGENKAILAIAPNAAALGNQFWRMPKYMPNGSKQGSHLYVDDRNGQIIEYSYTAPGGDGTLSWTDYLGNIKQITFEKGIAIDFTGATWETTPKTVIGSDSCSA